MKKMYIVALPLGILSAIIISIASYSNIATSRTLVPNWVGGVAEYAAGTNFSTEPMCVKEKITVGSYKSRVYADNPEYINHGTYTEQDGCVYHARGYRYVQYTRYYYLVPSWPALGAIGEAMVAISVGQETEYRPVLGFGDKDSDVQLYLGDSEAFLQHGSSDSGFRLYQNVTEHLYEDSDGSLILDDNPDYRYTDVRGNQVGVDGVGLSPNGEKISFGVKNFGIIVYDIITNKATRVSDRYDVQSWTWPTPQLSTSVSDDGKYVVVGGMGYQTEVITVTSCGSINLADGFAYKSQLLGKDVCPYVDLTSLTQENSEPTGGAGLRALSKLQMSGSGGIFTYWDNYKWGMVYAPNYLKPGQLYYLALGDSYASGEGDITIDGTDHYFSGTNVYGDYLHGVARETCHESSRAYPLLMANHMNLTRGIDMHTVACSGAVTTDILSSDKKINGYIDTNYRGQYTQLVSSGGPRLTGISDATLLQMDARSNYIPGRVQQIELMKKAQPKYATVMIGGNDIDFGGVMMACAKNALPSAEETCDYAQGDGLAGEAQKIHDLYPKLVDFYRSLKEVSPRTVIYAIGYPQFMDESKESCAEMLNLYSKPERAAIHNLIAYANAVIRNAALDSGVKYIDISNSLTGNELCASGTSMTGISDVLAAMIYTEYMKSLTMSDSKIAKYLNILPSGALREVALRLYLVERAAELLSGYNYSPATAIADIAQELAHPNAKGHEAIYHSIKRGLGEDLLESDACNQQVVCPDGAVIGQPNVSAYIPGLNLKNDTVFISGNGKIRIERKNRDGSITVGALAKATVNQTIRIAKNILPLLIDSSEPVTVELHSVPTMLGVMNSVSDEYELRVKLPDAVVVGEHILHVKGTLMGGKRFDVDSPVFVEGPQEDIDDDGIQNSDDTCAFSQPVGVDEDADGLDDKCDFMIIMQEQGSITSMVHDTNDEGLGGNSKPSTGLFAATILGENFKHKDSLNSVWGSRIAKSGEASLITFTGVLAFILCVGLLLYLHYRRLVERGVSK